jgi:acetate kinase
VFTGGIGEHSAAVRDAACETLEFLGVALDPASNTALIGEGDISSSTTRTRVLVVHAREDWMIARGCWEALQN